MKTNDLKVLLSTEDRIVAEDIQSILEEHDIYTMLVSDNPASSIITTYSGLNPGECVDIQINENDSTKYDLKFKNTKSDKYRTIYNVNPNLIFPIKNLIEYTTPLREKSNLNYLLNFRR